MSLRGMQSSKDDLKHNNFQCNTVSFTKKFIKKGRGAHKLYLDGLEEDKRIEIIYMRDACEDTVGVQMDIVKARVLLNVDDAVLIAENESYLQNITSKDRSQWKVVLEQNASSYYWSVDESKKSVSTQEVTFITNNSIDVELMSRRSSHLPTARSRLQGLKQLSVEKLASLRHKLAETRSKGIVASIADSSHSKQGE
uniref:Uncharacterized protein n=1 Tax=Timema monikensis TaxID=170555 RepID=A0A7R9EII8_9NEOP|nr:unnamed protein product [Timema monikensis]